MDPKDLGDVRTERGDLVPEKWAPTYESCSHPDISLMKCVPMTHWAKTLGDCITELASWQARAEQAESTVAAWKKAATEVIESHRHTSHPCPGVGPLLRVVSRSTDLEREDGK